MGCGGGGGGTNTVIQQPNLPEWFQNDAQATLDQGISAAQTPYQAYGGEQVAGTTGQQQASYNQTANYAGAGQGLVNTATGAVDASGKPIAGNFGSFTAPGVAQSYMSPYIQNVVDSSNAEIQRSGAISNQSIQGNAAQAGAFGGDRATIAQTENARNTAQLVGQNTANLENQGYQQAQGQFNTENNLQFAAQSGDTASQARAASLYAGLGSEQQQLGLTGATALNTAGTQQQQTQQAIDTAGYNNFNQQAYWDMTQAQFGSGILHGFNAQPFTGQTQTSPVGNATAQGIGLGIAGIAGLSGTGYGLARGGMARMPNPLGTPRGPHDFRMHDAPNGSLSLSPRFGGWYAEGGDVRGYAGDDGSSGLVADGGNDIDPYRVGYDAPPPAASYPTLGLPYDEYAVMADQDAAAKAALPASRIDPMTGSLLPLPAAAPQATSADQYQAVAPNPGPPGPSGIPGTGPSSVPFPAETNQLSSDQIAAMAGGMPAGMGEAGNLGTLAGAYASAAPNPALAKNTADLNAEVAAYRAATGRGMPQADATTGAAPPFSKPGDLGSFTPAGQGEPGYSGAPGAVLDAAMINRNPTVAAIASGQAPMQAPPVTQNPGAHQSATAQAMIDESKHGLIPQSLRIPLMQMGLAMAASKRTDFGGAVAEGWQAGLGSFIQQKAIGAQQALEQQKLTQARDIANQTNATNVMGHTATNQARLAQIAATLQEHQDANARLQAAADDRHMDRQTANRQIAANNAERAALLAERNDIMRGANADKPTAEERDQNTADKLAEHYRGMTVDKTDELGVKTKVPKYDENDVMRLVGSTRPKTTYGEAYRQSQANPPPTQAAPMKTTQPDGATVTAADGKKFVAKGGVWNEVKP